MNSKYCLNLLAFTWRTSFSIYCKLHLFSVLFSFTYLGMCLFCLHIWKIVLLDVRLLLDSFSFKNFDYIIPLLSGLHCLAEKSVVNLIGIPLLSVVFLLLLSQFCLWAFYHHVTGCGYLCVCLIGVFWASWMCRFFFLITFGKFQLFFLEYFFWYFVFLW